MTGGMDTVKDENSTRSQTRARSSGINEVMQLWELLHCAPEGDEGWRKPEKWKDACLKERDVLIQEKSLGFVLRLIIIREFTGFPIGEFFERLGVTTSKGKKDHNIQKILRLNNEYCPNLEKKFDRAKILALVNERRSLSDLLLDNIESTEFLFDKPFEEKEAVQDYMKMLRSAHSFPQPLVKVRKFFFHQDEERKVAAKKLLEAVAPAQQNEGNKPMLVNVWAVGASFCLSGCAIWLAETQRKAGDFRPVLVIPLVRPPEVADSAKPNPTASSRAEILNLSEIVGILRDFVGTEKHDLAKVADAKPMRDSEGLFDVIHQIRLRLAKEPAIIIFDGYFIESRNTQQIRRYVSDNSVENLILRLLEPPICSLDEPIDLACFRKNRIVVMSNRGLVPEERVPTILGVNKSIEIFLPHPQFGLWEKVIDGHEFFNPIETKSLLKLDKLRNSQSDWSYLLDGCAGIMKSLPDPAKKYLEFEGFLKGNISFSSNIISIIVENLLTKLKDWKPLWREIFFLVSLTPDGLRPDTIRRFARRASSMDQALCPMPELAQQESKGTLAAELLTFLQAALPILGPFRSDAFEGVDELNHPLEFGTYATLPEATDGPIALRSIDFLFPDVKAEVQNYAVQSLTTLHFHSAHRLLAEEALQQQTISLRHIDGTNLQSIRPWRRMVSAFYHGLQSLPIQSEPSGDDAAHIKDVDFGGRDLASVGPAVEFWRYLYAFCYRRMIERPPAWNLSRLYGLDMLKAALLDAFDRPWNLWPEPFMVKQSRKPSRADSLFRTYARRDPGGLAQAEDHRSALVQASLAVGNLDMVEALLSKEKIKEGSPNLWYLKRRMDLRLLQCESFHDLNIHGILQGIIGEYYQEIDHHLEIITNKFMSIVQSGDLNSDDLRSEYENIFHFIGFGVWSSDEFSTIGDIFLRQADLHMNRGKLAQAALRSSPGNSLTLADLPILEGFPVDDPDAIDRELCRSFTIYRFAEQLRLKNFTVHPLGGQFFASGHAARQSIRVAIDLELHTREAAKSVPPNIFGPFARYARRMADTLTRHLFRYPRERASQFIIEASIIRQLSLETSGQKHLMLARQYLGRAEQLALGLGQQARIRMWLFLERANLSAALALACEPGHSDRFTHLANCHYDVLQLEQLAYAWRLPIWEARARIQRNLLREMEEQSGGHVPVIGVGTVGKRPAGASS